jgi:hypothetical protein
MKEGQRLKGPHVIRLQNRRVEVQLEYHSPPKNERTAQGKDEGLPRRLGKEEEGVRSSKKILHLKSFKSIKRMPLTNTSPFCYLKTIEEAHPLLPDYEKFHQRMVQN